MNALYTCTFVSTKFHKASHIIPTYNYTYISSKAIHLWNCLFASLPEINEKSDIIRALQVAVGQHIQTRKYTIKPLYYGA